MVIAQHSSKNDSWMTPVWVLNPAREVLGGRSIGLDPASSKQANERVQASHIYTAEDDGLKQSWNAAAVFQEIPNCPSSVWCNPPGGKTGPRPMDPSRTVLFWRKLLAELELGNVSHALFLMFNIEGLRTCKVEHPTCIFDQRIKFDNPDGTSNKNPTHANALVYVPGTIDRTDFFADTFTRYGTITVPYFKP